MIKRLLSLLGTPASAPSAKRPAPVVRKAPAADRDFRAVAICSSGVCCEAARATAGTRILMRATPRLPLADCTMPGACSCRFRKVSDRRDSDRRLFGGAAVNRWYTGTEHRQLRGRRSLDPRPS